MRACHFFLVTKLKSPVAKTASLVFIPLAVQRENQSEPFRGLRARACARRPGEREPTHIRRERALTQRGQSKKEATAKNCPDFGATDGATVDVVRRLSVGPPPFLPPWGREEMLSDRPASVLVAANAAEMTAAAKRTTDMD